MFPFQTLFAVPMTCVSCVESVSDSLYRLDGISQVEANLADQLVSIEGTAPPSAIVKAIQATGRDAILRGSGASDSAAVSILEKFPRPRGASPFKKDGESDREVRGLARMVQVSPNATIVDLTLRGLAPGTYRATIREYGDLKEGAASTGAVWSGTNTWTSTIGGTSPGILGVLKIDEHGQGNVFVNLPFQVWEVIGHALIVSSNDESDGLPLQNDENTVVGVIARSAGMWNNVKRVCSCTGKTLWDERKDEVKKGMI